MKPKKFADKPPCRCSYCVSCCSHKPGMFKPGEPEKVAKHLGLSLPELFREKLAVDVVHDVDRDTYTILPAIKEAKNAGGMYRFAEGGTCIFLKGGKCTIQAVKPWECRVTDHTTADKFTRQDESRWARAWRRHQKKLEVLVGHKLPQRAVTGIKDWEKTRSTSNVARTSMWG